MDSAEKYTLSFSLLTKCMIPGQVYAELLAYYIQHITNPNKQIHTNGVSKNVQSPVLFLIVSQPLELFYFKFSVEQKELFKKFFKKFLKQFNWEQIYYFFIQRVLLVPLSFTII